MKPGSARRCLAVFFLANGVLWSHLAGSSALHAQNDFTDSFDRADGPVDGWTSYRGSWNLTGGRLRSGGGVEAWLWAGAGPITLDGDFELTLKVDFAFTPADSVGRHGGLMFFAGSPSERTGNTGYTLDWIDREGDHGFRLIRYDGEPTTLVGGTPGIAEPPAFWSVTIEGDRIVVEGDGVPVIDIVDGTYRQGHFGVWSYSNSEILLDDVAISSGPPRVRACFAATPWTGEVPLQVSFDASCSQGTEDEEIASYAWSFGDGDTASGSQASHTFDTADTYAVTLTVTGDAGTTAMTSRIVSVLEPGLPPPVDVDRLLWKRVKRSGAHADSTVVFNEVMYHPATNEDALEWFELYNQMAVDMDVSNWIITGGIYYAFPADTVIPGGGFLVIARDPAAFATASGVSGALGPFAGRLDNAGEDLSIVSRSGRQMDLLRYGDRGDWPPGPDGSGVSLAKLDPLSSTGPAENWAPSTQVGGTPGQPNFPATGSAVSQVPGLISYWGFDEQSGAASDPYGGNTGTIGSAAVRTQGIVGSGALDFAGTTAAYVQVGAGVDNNFSVTEGIAIEAMVGVSWSGTLSDADMIFRKEDGSSRMLLGFQHDGNGDGNSFPPLAPGYTGPVLAFGIKVGGVYSELELRLDGQSGRPTVAALRNGSPHHIAGTYDAASGVKSIFLDGVRVAQVALASGSEIQSGGVTSAYIGNLAGHAQPYTGLIDEVAVWSRALSAEEVATHYERALGGEGYFDAMASAASALAFNEFVVVSPSEYTIELVNFGAVAVQLEGCSVSSGSASEYQFGNRLLQPGQYLVLSRAELGFDLGSEKLFLFSPEGQRVLDAAHLADVHRGRHPDGIGPWLVPSSPTLGTANAFQFEDSIVINEIHYHPRIEQAKPDVFAETTLIAPGATWKYDATGRDLGTSWRTVDFDDSDWDEGAAVLYNETADLPWPKRTEVPLGIITHYFRTSFDLAEAVEGDLELRLLVDDGAVVYLNGAEILRYNMPEGTIASSSLAPTGIGDATLTGPYTLPSDGLRAGTNVVAVEVHQGSVGSSDVVFAAEMFASVLVEAGHPSREPPESWMELYNRGDVAVDLSGWEIDRGIDFAFEAGTGMAPGEFLVIAEDADLLRARHPGARIVGNFTDRLSDRNDLIVLKDSRGNPVDSVEYFDSGRWPELADGGGSSLELRNPWADNSKGEAWAASDESASTEWKTYSYRQVAAANVGPTLWHEFVIGLLSAGEVLIDDLSVIRSPNQSPVQILQDGDFEDGAGTWRILGNHRHSAVIDDPDAPGNKVLHLVAVGPTEHMHNHLETTLVGNAAAPNGVEYEVSFRARWIAGSNQLNTRLYFNRIPRTTLIDVPALGGTPGAVNSAYEEDIGPTFDGLRHSPAVPAAGRAVLVSVFVEDPDGIARVSLWWSAAGGAWQSTPMTRPAGAESLYTALIPARSASSIVQFYVEGEDSLGAVSAFPARGRDSRALYKVEDGQARQGLIHDFRIIMTAADAAFLHAETNVMSNEHLGATVVYREEEVFYDVGCRLKGSQRGRLGDSRVSFNVRFNSDELFRGAHRTVSLDRSGGWGIGAGPNGQDEIMVKHATNRAGLPGMHDDLAWLVAPYSAQNGPCLLMMAKYGSVFVSTQYPDDSEGSMYKTELIYYPTTTVGGGPEGLKRPQPDEVLGTDLVDLGDDKEAYRWNFLLENNEDRDDYGRFMELSKAMGSSGASFEQRMEAVLDIDEATRMYVVRTLFGVGDTWWFAENYHNVMFYELPTTGRFVILGWDDDFAFAHGTSSALWGGPNLARLYSIPKYERLFYTHLQDILDDFYDASHMKPWTDHYGLLAEETWSFDNVLAWMDARGRYARSRLPAAVSFAITTNGGNDFVTDTSVATIEGTAWVDVRWILVPSLGTSPEVSWPARDRWSMTVPLVSGANELAFIAIDASGDVIHQDTIVVTSTAVPTPGEFVRGDANRDLRVDLSDAIATLLSLFGPLELSCPDAADANDDESLNLTDAIVILDYLFRSGVAPPAPFPSAGLDVTGNGSLNCP